MDERYWDPQLETLPVERRRILQDHRLRWQVRRCWDGSPFYRARLEAAGIDPATFGGITDLHRIPILNTADLPVGETQDGPSEAWTVAPREWSCGVIPLPSRPPRLLTDGDEIHQQDLVARALWAGNVRPKYGLSRFDCVAAGPDWSPVIIAGAGRIEALANGVRGDVAETSQAIWTDVWPVADEFDDYPVTALGLWSVAPTVAYKCQDASMLHWNDDHFLTETVDPSSDELDGTGDVGAVVVTDLTREGSPLLRFWTGLEANLIKEPCICGRTSARSAVIRSIAGG